jgi:hypothetical protein
MNIASGTGSGVALAVLGTCTPSGCPNLRMDNLTFSNWAGHANVGNSYGMAAIGDMFGVADHNTINGVAGNYLQLAEVANASYLGVGYYGDNSWAQPEFYGSANFLFFENNTFNNSGTSDNEGSAGSLQNEGGGRLVVRYNTFNIDNINAAIAWHGTESNGRPRSGRTWEFYDNTINCPSSTECQAQVGARGGTGLTWNNTINFASNSGMSTFENLDTFRTQESSGGWGACDGSAPFDTNDGVTYYSGTVGSVSGSYTITVSGSSPAWTTNQWSPNGAPYSVHDVTQSTGSEITSNTGNTLTITYSGVAGSWTPVVGDSIQILRATACIDQAGGRGAGYLYSGAPPQSTPANEIVSPSYSWMNSFSGATPSVAVVYADTARVIANRNFYTETANQAAQTNSSSPFNGISGMGHAVFANRPATCTTGVAYWATDQNTLYQCTSANTWTAFYSPYTYPHPLTTTTGTAPPAAPTGLQVTAQ